MRLVLCHMALLLAGSVRPAQAQFLHRSHTAIVDGTGRPIQLRGVNLGNWLWREPWMIGDTKFPADDDEDGQTDAFGAALQDVTGTAARAAAFQTAWRDNFITQPDIAEIGRLGFNSVRVPMDYRLFYDKAAHRDTDVGFVYLDRLRRWCAAAHLYVILDMHCVPGGKRYAVPGNIFRRRPDRQDLLAHVWQRIAARYQADPTIAGYELINEPAVNNSGTSALRDLYLKLTVAIRQVDTNHLILAEGDNYGSWLDSLGDRWDENMAVSDHNYGTALPAKPEPGSNPPSYSGFSLPRHKQAAARMDVPLWMGEFGYNSNPWNNTQKTLCEQADPMPIGWCVWSYKSTAPWSLVTHALPAGYAALQAYWRHDPKAAKPAPAAAFVWLMQAAQQTAYARCTVRRDVVDALTRPDFARRAVPYDPNLSIPGVIPALNYDMGADGVAYHDQVSENTGGMGAGFTAWNNGNVGRNDGVDLFRHPDGPTDYSIGGIQAGEWLRYTVRCTPGTYTLRLRCGGSGGRMRVSINGTALAGPITLPATGGWDRFQTRVVHGVKITARGPSVLRLDFDTSGFNLSRLEFIP